MSCLRITVAQQQPIAEADSDKDGMSDVLEQALLQQFAPRFMVPRHDCSLLPAEFVSGVEVPTVKAVDGTIYGQVFPARSAADGLPAAEIHYYHLWSSDCGPHGHPLDTEHVSVLVTASTTNLDSAKWKALYWYAAAHEETVCDVSQIARASTLHAQDGGASVYISPGKHASYLDQRLCHAGCGADKCPDLVALRIAKVVNLGETAHPMNGAVFIASSRWPLLGKMSNSNFPAEPVARLNQMPDTDIAWFKPGKHPAQGIIAVSGTTQQAISIGANDTSASLDKAGNSTDAALSVAGNSTGNAIQKSYTNTTRALGATAKHVSSALRPSPKIEKPK